MNEVREVLPPTPERMGKSDWQEMPDGNFRAVEESYIHGLYVDRILTIKQLKACWKYQSLYRKARKPQFRSCLNIQIGAALPDGDGHIVDKLHRSNMFDYVRGLVSPVGQKWLQCILLDGDTLTEAVGTIGGRKANARAMFLEAVEELEAAFEFADSKIPEHSV